jgi:hypothetical protein
MLAAASSTVLRRTSAISARKSLAPSIANSFVGKRWKSDDVGDVIGIDLGTTNSCVAIMVRYVEHLPKATYKRTEVVIGT